MKIGTLVQHKSITLLARVIGLVADDDERVVIQPLTDNAKPFECAKAHLMTLG